MRLLTPDYASPEQVRGRASHHGERRLRARRGALRAADRPLPATGCASRDAPEWSRPSAPPIRSARAQAGDDREASRAAPPGRPRHHPADRAAQGAGPPLPVGRAVRRRRAAPPRGAAGPAPGPTPSATAPASSCGATGCRVGGGGPGRARAGGRDRRPPPTRRARPGRRRPAPSAASPTCASSRTPSSSTITTRSRTCAARARCASGWCATRSATSTGSRGKRRDDPSLQRELAGAYRRVGDLQSERSLRLGDTEGAARSYGKALAISEAAAPRRQQHPAARRDVAAAALALGAVVWERGDLAGGLAHAQRARALLEPLVAAAPTRYRSAAAAQHRDRPAGPDLAGAGRDRPRPGVPSGRPAPARGGAGGRAAAARRAPSHLGVLRPPGGRPVGGGGPHRRAAEPPPQPGAAAGTGQSFPTTRRTRTTSRPRSTTSRRCWATWAGGRRPWRCTGSSSPATPRLPSSAGSARPWGTWAGTRRRWGTSAWRCNAITPSCGRTRPISSAGWRSPRTMAGCARRWRR